MQQSYLISRQPDYPGQYLTIPDQNQSSVFPTMQYQTIPVRMSQSRYIPPISVNPNPNYNNNNNQYYPYPSPSPPQSSAIFQNNSLALKQNNNNPNNWNLQNGQNLTNVANFPFGKQRAQMYNYVQGQMQTSIDQENKKIIQKFRIDAIRHRNQRVIKHLGKVPYVTQSMMPGTSIDASKFVQKITPTQIPQPRYISVPIRYTPPILPAPTPIRKPSPYQSPYQSQSQSQSPQRYPIIKTPRKLLTNSSSIAIQVNFQQQFPIRDNINSKQKHKNNNKKRRYYTIEQQQQQLAMHKIEDMLHDINRKLQRNQQLLQLTANLQQGYNSNSKRSRINTEPVVNDDEKGRNRKYFQDAVQDAGDGYGKGQKLPTIKYTSVYQKEKQKQKGRLRQSQDGKKVKNTEVKFSNSLKDHLKLLKKNRKRMEDLDQYIYQ